jgi:hypothetical protein
MAKKKHHGSNVPDTSLGQVNCETYHKTVGSGYNWASMAPNEQTAWQTAADAVVQAAAQPESLGDITIPYGEDK